MLLPTALAQIFLPLAKLFLRESGEIEQVAPIRKQIAALAAEQHGIVTTDDLRALGIASGSISKWTKLGYLHRVQPRVYAVGHRRLTVRGHWMAAVRSFSCPAVLSDLSAAQLHGLAEPRLPIEVTVPRHTGATRKRVRCRQRGDLLPDEQTALDSIPVTTVPRTLFDLAGSLPTRNGGSPDEVEKIAAAAWRNGALDLDELHDLYERSSRRRGVVAFRALLGRLDPQILTTRSGGERALVRLLRRAGLDGFAVNQQIGRYEVDIIWHEERLILEFDGAAYHSDSRAFERDHRRDAHLKERGYEVLRITYRMITESPKETVEAIRAVLASRRW